MSGYSGTPLPRKLGIKPGARVPCVAAPDGFGELLQPLPDDVALLDGLDGGADVVVFFTRSRAALEARIRDLERAIAPDGAAWVAWPKKSSGVETDMTEDVVREVALPLGLVDNKVCAIDETWSGLRLVIRVSRRSSSG